MLTTYVNVVPGRTEPGSLPSVEITQKRLPKSPMSRRTDFIGGTGFLKSMIGLPDTRAELSGIALAGFELGARWAAAQIRKAKSKKAQKSRKKGRTRIHIRGVSKKRFKKEMKRRK